jgi:hypothetical protein
VPSFDQHVGGHREFEAGVGPHEGAIVADAEDRAIRRAVEEAPDDLEFVQAGR